MKAQKDKVLYELNDTIKTIHKMIEILQSLKINKTKKGDYFKKISKVGLEMTDKEHCDLTFSHISKKYVLMYRYYYLVSFENYKDLENQRNIELEKLRNYLSDYIKQKEYAERNYQKIIDKTNDFFKSLNEDEITLLKNINSDLYIELSSFK